MSTTIEFGDRATANELREEDTDHLTGRFDRRHKSLEVAEGSPEEVLQAITAAAQDSWADHASGPGQISLTRGERDRVDWSKEGANASLSPPEQS